MKSRRRMRYLWCVLGAMDREPAQKVPLERNSLYNMRLPPHKGQGYRVWRGASSPSPRMRGEVKAASQMRLPCHNGGGRRKLREVRMPISRRAFASTAALSMMAALLPHKTRAAY